MEQIYIISDVEGCYKTLLALIDQLPNKQNSKIVFVVDLIYNKIQLYINNLRIKMIIVNISENEVHNSNKTNELYNYLLKKGYQLSLETESVDGAKADLATKIAIVSLLFSSYPVIQDLQNWVRPTKYNLTITDGNISGTINDLTQEEYENLLKKLNKEVTKIEIN